MNKVLAIAAALAASASLPSAASAATTIVTGGGWTIKTPSSEIVASTPGNSQIPGSWAPNNANMMGSAWISPTANPISDTSPAGLYTFTGIFNLSNIGNVQSWSATWWADNIVRAIIVNGTQIFTGVGSSQSQDFQQPGVSQVFTNPVWKNGANTVSFVIENGAGASGNPTGLQLASVLTAVPEPGTWMLMILGLGAVGFAMRRRQNTSVRLQFA